MRDLTGHRIGAIELIVLIGRGGMGEVYRGFDHKLGRPVAVKTIRVDARISAELKARFVREARLLSRIGHPAICLVHDLIETPSADFLVLEYISGRNLRQSLSAGIGAAQLLDIAEQIARALAAAHEHKVVHRDLKPENVMLTEAGQVKVLDFGIARSIGEDDPVAASGQVEPEPKPDPRELAASLQLDTQLIDDVADGTRLAPHSSSTSSRVDSAYLTEAGQVLGTKRYMSPEQAAGRPVDASTDLYSFGILIEEMLEAWEQCAQRAPGEQIDTELLGLIKSLKQLDPAARPTAPQAAARLQDLREKPQRLRSQRMRRRLATLASLILLVLLAVTGVALLESRRARAEAETRTRQAEDLISFMMFDLREKLAEVGKLELLDETGQRALAYFEVAGSTTLTARELEVLLKTLNQLTELRITNARYAEAHQLSARAQALARSRLAQTPRETATWASLLCEAQTMDGYAHMEQEANTEARRVLAEAVAQCDLALKAGPTQPAVLQIAAATYNAQGALLSLLSEPEPAILALRHSIGLYRQLQSVADSNEVRGLLAASFGWLSSAHEAHWDLAAARQARADNVRILEQLRADEPQNRVIEADLCVSLRYRARLELAAGSADQAVDSLRQSLEISRQLFALDPDNMLWRRDLALQQAQLGWALFQAGEQPEATAVMDQALLELRSFLALDPENADRLRLLAQTEQRRALVAQRSGQSEAALRWLSAARGRWEKLLAVNSDLPANRLGLAQTQWTLATVHQASGNSALATQALQEARARIEQITGPARDFEVVTSHWQILRDLHEPAADELQRRLRSGGFIGVLD